MGEVYSARVRTRTKLIERKMVKLKSCDESDHSASWIEDRYRQSYQHECSLSSQYQERVDSVDSDKDSTFKTKGENIDFVVLLIARELSLCVHGHLEPCSCLLPSV